MQDVVASDRLTPRDLVTHRSGLPRHDLLWYNNLGESRKPMVARLAFLEPSADIRTKFQYNNLMFLTAGYLSEVMTGKSWEASVKERIFDPLDMARTNFSIDETQKDEDFAQPYEKKDDKIVKVPFRSAGNVGPAGAINSSVNEMSRWVQVQLNGGAFGDKKLANKATVADMQQAYMPTGATVDKPEVTPADYAMGWFVDTYRGHRRVHHGGNIDGFSANVVLYPQDGVGIVVLTNLGGTAMREVIARVAADHVLGLEPKPWVAEAASRRAKGEAARDEAKKKKDTVRVPGTVPSHKLLDFAGDYENPGYGALKVALAKGVLDVTFNNIVTPLEHWHYDTFNGMKAKDDVFDDTRYTFQTDPEETSTPSPRLSNLR
jgi:CubicO group peptidase (beta-lactamase class C family)